MPTLSRPSPDRVSSVSSACHAGPIISPTLGWERIISSDRGASGHAPSTGRAAASLAGSRLPSASAVPAVCQHRGGTEEAWKTHRAGKGGNGATTGCRRSEADGRQSGDGPPRPEQLVRHDLGLSMDTTLPGGLGATTLLVKEAATSVDDCATSWDQGRSH